MSIGKKSKSFALFKLFKNIKMFDPKPSAKTKIKKHFVSGTMIGKKQKGF